jgi:RNA 2',3'-cyclic 3'-phosphodiesterase
MTSHLSKQADVPRIRTFLAVELPEAAKAKLAQLQHQFIEHSSCLKWVSSNLLHITVRFLGRLSEARLDEVEEAARKGAASTQPFSLGLARPGAFPNERAPKVLWVGLEQDSGLELLRSLYDRLEDELSLLGFEREKRGFSPHITIGRVRDEVDPPKRRKLGATLALVKKEIALADRFDVGELIVMKSVLSPSGPRYTALTRAQLAQDKSQERRENGNG